jgi:hypothetical protein
MRMQRVAQSDYRASSLVPARDRSRARAIPCLHKSSGNIELSVHGIALFHLRRPFHPTHFREAMTHTLLCNITVISIAPAANRCE